MKVLFVETLDVSKSVIVFFEYGFIFILFILLLTLQIVSDFDVSDSDAHCTEALCNLHKPQGPEIIPK